MTPRAAPPRPDPVRHLSTLSKASVPSLSQSNEADDEQSASVRSSNMERAHGASPLPSYAGQDTRPTSSRELWGFYMYGWAAEVSPRRCSSFLALSRSPPGLRRVRHR